VKLPANNHNGTFRLDDTVAVVTGGGSGIGRAIAECFAGHGARIHILDVDQKHAECAAAEIERQGGKASAHLCNVSLRAQVQETLGRIMQREHVNILVNSAGIAHVGKLENTTEDDFNRVFDVNVKGVYNCMLVCIDDMKANGGGVILNLASIASSAGIPDRFAYSMSKGAVLSMTYSVARDYLQHNVRCNCISPARVYTPFVDGFVRKNYPGQEREALERLANAQPIGRMAEPHEVASLALYLCSKEAAFITGVDYPIDGGFFNIR
jgi:NAD(P)-dependent dehydrogenase (short-subunit alcohol dehydrogenase family)